MEHIARISYGKDSLKMLQVIHSRGLPLDRITTTDVWATDTISANLPPMEQFKAKMDQWIWDAYRIEVEHLCALNPDGSKRTYEQMFYHVPVRKNSQTVQVERDKVRNWIDSRLPSYRSTMVPRPQTEVSRDSREHCRQNGAKSSNMYGFQNQGFPAQISPWCRKLKIDKVRTPFSMSTPRGAEIEISWSTLVLLQTNQNGLVS